jgi:hypothetical protein
MVPVEENDLKPKNFGAIYHCRSVVVVVAVTRRGVDFLNGCIAIYTVY